MSEQGFAGEDAFTQRDHILRALARGDGQRMDSFDFGQTAETMYGGQADAIELVIAERQRAALLELARSFEDDSRLMRGLPSDKARRQELARVIQRAREQAKRITKVAQQRYDERSVRT